MSAYKNHHLALEKIFNLITIGKFNPHTYFDIDTLTVKQTDADMMKSLKYLISGKYLDYEIIEGTPVVKANQSAADAYYSEYFLDKHKEVYAKKTERRVMIICNIVLAAGVLFTLYKDNFIPAKPSKELTEILSKLTDRHTDSTSSQTRIFPAPKQTFAVKDTVPKKISP